MNHSTQAGPEADEPAEQRRIEAVRLSVRQFRAFVIHAGVFAAGVTAIFMVNLATNLSAGIAGQSSAWWSVWAFIGWGFGIAVHGLAVRLNRPSGSWLAWEQRQVDKVLVR